MVIALSSRHPLAPVKSIVWHPIREGVPDEAGLSGVVILSGLVICILFPTIVWSFAAAGRRSEARRGVGTALLNCEISVDPVNGLKTVSFRYSNRAVTVPSLDFIRLANVALPAHPLLSKRLPCARNSWCAFPVHVFPREES
jgi:hypothetical protein